MADSTVDLQPVTTTDSQVISSSAKWHPAKDYWTLEYEPIPKSGRLFKRCIDLLISIPSLIFLAPFCAIVAIAIKIDSKGPVFYRSTRMGKKGRYFVCFKFRSMVVNADELKERLRKENERHGPTFKIENDPRVTRLGRFIRRYSIDEIPQLMNVVRGEMSIVGPRPHPLDDVARYKPEHLRRCVVKPGLTCIWQVRARRDPSFKVNMDMDLSYIDQWDLLLDLKIILSTFVVVLRGEGQ